MLILASFSAVPFSSETLPQTPESRMRDKRANLTAYLLRLQHGGDDIEWEWRRAATAQELSGQAVWHQLALLWAPHGETRAMVGGNVRQRAASARRSAGVRARMRRGSCWR